MERVENKKHPHYDAKLYSINLQRGSAMNYRAILSCSFLFASTTTSFAQDPSGRIDLDVVSGSRSPVPIIARVSFAGSDSQCPEDHGTLLTSGGRWGTHRGLNFTEKQN